MKIIGLTGKTGAGKGVVGVFLAEKGAVVDLDAIGHGVILRGEPAYDDIIAAFGAGVAGEDGEIDRRRLGSLVFGDAERLAALSAMTHPRIIEACRRELDRLRLEGAVPFAAIDAPLLYEAGMDAMCDGIIIVEADDDKRVERLIKRDGLSREEASLRVSSRPDSLTERATDRDLVVYNNGTADETIGKVAAWLNDFLS